MGIRKELERYAEVFNAKLNSNENLRETIIHGLERNEKLNGAYYCPCSVNKDVNTICPCKDMRESRTCHCKLFVWE